MNSVAVTGVLKVQFTVRQTKPYVVYKIGEISWREKERKADRDDKQYSIAAYGVIPAPAAI